MKIELAAGGYALTLSPELGGSIARFDWQGEPLMRRRFGDSILEVSCFPLVPFCNRIAHGEFAAGSKRIKLQPNMPGGDHPHPLHGFGWLSSWTVIEQGEAHVLLRHDHQPDQWPWAYEAEQHFGLTDGGLHHTMCLRNMGDTPMPAGLGFHPYFPRTEQTTFHGLHCGEWTTSGEGLPVSLDLQTDAKDRWRGQPVATRPLDTVYVKRQGLLTITWPERRLGLTIDPSAGLEFTAVFAPNSADFFCIEPSSQMTDAVNHPDVAGNGLVLLEPGEELAVSVSYHACSTPN